MVSVKFTLTWFGRLKVISLSFTMMANLNMFLQIKDIRFEFYYDRLAKEHDIARG